MAANPLADVPESQIVEWLRRRVASLEQERDALVDLLLVSYREKERSPPCTPTPR